MSGKIGRLVRGLHQVQEELRGQQKEVEEPEEPVEEEDLLTILRGASVDFARKDHDSVVEHTTGEISWRLSSSVTKYVLGCWSCKGSEFRMAICLTMKEQQL